MSLAVSEYFRHWPVRDGHAVALNSRTGGSYAFTTEAYARLLQVLQEPNRVGHECEMREWLIAEDILVSLNRDELAEVKGKFLEARESTEELFVTFSLTNACNFRCTYCYQDHKKDKMQDASIEKSFRYIENNINKFARLKVHWFGGEPLLQLRTIEELSPKLKELCKVRGKEYFAGITTNGSLLDDRVASKLIECSVRQIQFTLDGARSTHNTTRLTKSGQGSYDKIINAIKIAIEHDFIVFVRINISNFNRGTIPKLLADFHEQGIGPRNIRLYINEMKQHGNSEFVPGMYFSDVAKYGEALVECLRALQDYGYPIPRITPVDINCAFDRESTILFGVDGNIYHCTTGTDRAMATLNEKGLIETEDPRRAQVHQRLPWDDPECRSCKNLPTCMGGCKYLEEDGKTKCNPEGFVIEDLLRLLLV